MYLPFFVAIAVGVAVAVPQYTTKYDNMDLDMILKNERLMKNYVFCLLERGRCTRDGAELKRLIGDALRTGCEKCNERQQAGSRKVIRHLIIHKPQWWNELEAKYDPHGIYRTKYEDELKREGLLSHDTYNLRPH